MNDKFWVLEHVRYWDYEGNDTEFCGVLESLEKAKEIAQQASKITIEWEETGTDYFVGNYYSDARWHIYRCVVNEVTLPLLLYVQRNKLEDTELTDFIEYLGEKYKTHNV